MSRPAPPCAPFPAPEASTPSVLSVSALARAVREAIERDLPALWVAGEISNFRRYDSGHCYFVLKDRTAQVRCVMFRGRAALLGWMPQDGMEVEARAVPTLYEPRGDFQLNVETLRRAGRGALHAAFERTKAKLQAEGLFEGSRKRPLPAFARTVGIVTSTAAAALRDLLTTLARRAPSLRVIIYPTLVQGEGAARQIARAIELAGERRECDVLVVGRGGGSIEDLWAFNEEVVARALAQCPIPTVSAVGHETDFTIADFVADARAATPTAAAVLVSPDAAEVARMLAALRLRLRRAQQRLLEQRMQRVDLASRRLVHPGARAREQGAALDHLRWRLASALQQGQARRGLALERVALALVQAAPDSRELRAGLERLAQRLAHAGERRLARSTARVERAQSSLGHLSPLAVLERGYSITRGADGRLLREAAAAAPGERIETTLARGILRSRVEPDGPG
ncbi:MAG: exodeoxyribonuclease VII large subunit [Pseudomonadota bacterium]